jgi:flagellar motility protein MotE (MotC chaperone)
VLENSLETTKIDNQLRKEKLRQLSLIYQKMNPEAAAKIFNEMDTSLASNILMMMKESKAAAIMNNMDPKKSKEIAEKIKKGENM